MRKTDINMEFTPDDVRTHKMYVPPKTPVEDMSFEELARHVLQEPSLHHGLHGMPCSVQLRAGTHKEDQQK